MNNLVDTKFYFPETDKPSVKEQIIKALEKDKLIDFVGFAKREYFESFLDNMLFEKNMVDLPLLSEEKRIAIEKEIQETFKTCHKELQHPSSPVMAYVFPWFPGEKQQVFKGVNALVPFQQVMHLFIDPQTDTQGTLTKTVSHEYNHLVYYAAHPSQGYSVYENMIMEGLAEVFREEVIGGDKAPWATALTENEAIEVFKNFKESELESFDRKKIESVLFGSNEYKKWTGYSIGYWLVKKHREMNQNLSWNEYVAQDPNVYKLR
tara:strand:- start:154881 stop:155672 length:792 start_codon:yes stop_codon:yes gene_type:complete